MKPGDEFDAVFSLSGAFHSDWKDHAVAIAQEHAGKTDDEVVSYICNFCVDMSKRSSVPLQQLAHEVVPLYMGLFLWGRSGCPHFSLTSDFFLSLNVTDFGDPTDEPLYMPFDAFTLSFPKTEFFGEANRIFVYKIPTVFREESGYKVEWKQTQATLFTKDPIFTRWMTGMTRREVVTSDFLLNKLADDGRKLAPEELPLLSRMRRLLANTVTYIESCGPLPTKPKEKKAAPAPVERLMDNRPLFDVGRVVKLDRGIREAMQAGVGNGPSWRLAQRFIVRGHWRNHAYGQNLSERKRIWIAPHWKGPENAAQALSKTYEVGAKE